MTSEVAVLNRNAIALAADSAVTVGGRKIYNSALKLFSLSKIAPVAIMVYGDALLHDTPWETIFKLYRRKLGSDKFDTVEEYAHDFLRFVIRQRSFVPLSSQGEWAIDRARYFLREDLLAYTEAYTRAVIESAGSITVTEAKRLASTAISAYYRSMHSLKRTRGVTAKSERMIFRRYRSQYDKLIKEELGQFRLQKNSIQQLRWCLVWFSTRVIKRYEGSGIVIAGFGERQLYPSVITHQITGIIGSRLVYRFLDEKSRTIEPPLTGSVLAFAQEDMVGTFMTGINMKVQQFIRDYINRIATRIGDLVPDSVLAGSARTRATFKRRFTKQTKDIAVEFLTEIQKHKQDYHIDPVMDMVNVLPKDELAAMAESLVNITAFKRRITPTHDTVGGPIDVLVISKGDGLVWVKRKLYFPENLNYGFFKNYMRGVSHGE